ncbi:DNA repair protein RecO [Paenibacillus sp. FSL H7-0942]|jgi:DNA repair protein RecO (recombination protein O)|uniref:DNA repair protein RecO n=1 Tax=Paenibacillus amylolyticus TaxID=1451 RepID=A0A1R1BTZ4_PAEAM|nr:MULTISPECIES: DNA repair protein RecO [Paenibacillus]APO46929.1 DNA repair protein RecO [Paenibacillus xylanexedens]KAA8754228.1 DNA repair protein RecO [Paenibacillus sp. UASWS1643]KLU55768.1 DNA recombination protein RecO [Paenibacillus sp. VT-400]MBD8839892.1 DNA repair protein RecO [Paenibacillus sp. CFBP 13594]MBY0117516.1 DNA repair protein RecO [Paenibacillus xylanexedens]
MLYRVEGIVIRSMDYGEGNKIITLCTESGGKVGVLVRGAKKPKSRHAALVQPFTYGQYVYFRNTGLGTLNAGEIVESYHELREDLVKASYASYACELLDRVLQDEETGTFWFKQLKACLQALKEEKDPVVITSLYEMKILQASGYGPQFDECISCNQERPDEQLFISPRLGGVLCRACKHFDPPAMSVSPKALKLLRLFAQLDLQRLGNISVSESTRDEIKKLMRAFMDHQLGLNLKSRSFLDQMEKYGI